MIEEKYLFDEGQRAGYSTCIGFMNELGLTSQVPSICEIMTNMTAREYRIVTVAGVPIVLRKPKVKIEDNNWAALRLLDSMKEIASFSEISGAERTRRLVDHMNAAGVRFQDLAISCLFTRSRFIENCTKRVFSVEFLHNNPELFAQTLALSVKKTARHPEIIDWRQRLFCRMFSYSETDCSEWSFDE